MSTSRDLELTWKELVSSRVTGQPIGLADLRLRPTTVTIEEGPVLIGIDVEARRHLLVPLSTSTPSRSDRQSRGVHAEVRTLLEGDARRVFLDVVCLLPHLENLFAA